MADFLPVLPEGEPIDQFLQTPVDYFSMDSEYYPFFTDLPQDLTPASIPYTKAVTAVPQQLAIPPQHYVHHGMMEPTKPIQQQQQPQNKKRKPEPTGVAPLMTTPAVPMLGIAPTLAKTTANKNAAASRSKTNNSNAHINNNNNNNNRKTATTKKAAVLPPPPSYDVAVGEEDDGDDGEYCEDGSGGDSNSGGGNKPTSDKERQRQQRLLKNRKAAQQFRRRQKSHIIELEGQVGTLSGENKSLKSQVQMLSTENKLIREQLEYMRSFVITVLQVNCSQTGAPAPTIHDFNAGLPRMPSRVASPGGDFGDDEGNVDENSSEESERT